MIIKSIRVRNFRSIYDETLSCEELTALVGSNGSGKSSFLRALDLFYTSNAKYSQEDFYNRDITIPIIITITFDRLLTPEKELFKPYMDEAGLTVEKELTWPSGRSSQKYFGSTLRNPGFQPIRASTKITDKRAGYRELSSSEEYSDLPNLAGNVAGATIDDELRHWEENHQDRLQPMRDEGQFFGFKEVGQSHLEKYTRFIYIPAVREASEDAVEGKGSVISELMDLVVRSTLSQRADIREFLDTTQKQYEEIMNPSTLTELQKLKDKLTETLNTFAPGAKVDLGWIPISKFEPPMPSAEVKVIEDGYSTEIERVGHGVQRAFILTALQHLAIAQSASVMEVEINQQKETTTSESGNQSAEGASISIVSNLILGIEEPEIYQHPSRQRHLARVLSELACGGISGVAQNTQIIYTTHSPLFVDLQRFHQIRLLRKEESAEGMPKTTKIAQTSMKLVAEEIERADGDRPNTHTPASEQARLQTLMTPWTNEGFFADVVALVEGEDDRVAIVGVAKALGYDFDALDIAVIPCMGKPNLHKAAIIFRNLAIPTYVVWDSDMGGENDEVKNNHRLLRLFNDTIEDYPKKVTTCFACFEVNLETTLRDELTPVLFNALLEECKSCYSYSKNKQAMKSPVVIQTMITKALELNKRSTTLEEIVRNIVGLHPGSAN